MTALIEFLEQHLFSCSIKSLLGVDCPGCGMQRAFIALLKGDLRESLCLNPSLLPFLFTLCFTICHLTFGFKNGARLIVVFFSATVLVMIFNFIMNLTGQSLN
ncbi:MAG: DUF2752 domain-containing protein [Bacteroidota bacterium]